MITCQDPVSTATHGVITATGERVVIQRYVPTAPPYFLGKPFFWCYRTTRDLYPIDVDEITVIRYATDWSPTP